MSTGYRKCCVPLCSSSRNSLKVSYHELPSNLILRQQWLTNIFPFTEQTILLSGNPVVCSLHFDVNCYLPNSTRLRRNAVPTTNIPALFQMPGMTCSVATCRAQFYNGDGEKIPMFSFPKDPVRQKEWIKRCHRQIEINPKNARVCNRHFTIDDLEDDCQMKLRLNLNYPQRLRLKNTAMPTLHLPITVNSVSIKTEEIQDDIPSTSVSIKTEEIQEDVPSTTSQDDYKKKYEDLLEENDNLQQKLKEQSTKIKLLEKKVEELEAQIKCKRMKKAVTSGEIITMGEIFVAPLLHIRNKNSRKTKQ